YPLPDGSRVHAVVDRMPLLEELYLWARGVDAGALFGLPGLTNLRLLQVQAIGDYPPEALAANPSLARLTHLMLSFSREAEPPAGLGHLEAIVRSPHLANLRHLSFHGSSGGDALCDVVARSGILGRLGVPDRRDTKGT